MSDLQCAARLLVTSPDGAPVAWLRGERVALVYDARGGSSDVPLADELGVAARPTDVPVSGADLTGVSEAVRGISDLHRGETVVLLVGDLGAGEVHEVLVDGDGTTHRRLR